MHIETRLTFDKVKHNQENEVSLVISLKAPKVDWQGKRMPICIMPVIDVSGSMSGDKIHYARLSVEKLIDHLKPGDYCGLVTFTDEAELIFPPMEITQTKKEELKAKVARLHHMGSTNFSGGMSLGLEQLNKSDLPKDLILRAIMFTDGLANMGVATTSEQILPFLEKELGKATLSAFGYGRDANQELLGDCAKKGKGNYAFIKNPDDALTAFAKELGGLLSVYAQGIEINLEATNGHKFVKVVSDVDVVEDNGKLKIKVPEILSEETRHIIVRMKLSEQTQALPRAVNVAEIKVTATIIEGGEKKPFSEEQKAKIQFVKPGEEQEKPTPEIDQIVGLADLIEAQLESEKLANAGDYIGACAVMKTAGSVLAQRGHVQLSANASKLGDMMVNKLSYDVNAGYRGNTRGMGRGMGMSEICDAAQADYQVVVGAMRNDAQVITAKSFIGGAAQPAPAVTVNPMPELPKPESKKGLSKSKLQRW
jgi:Ca-activated chloride channel family protein